MASMAALATAIQMAAERRRAAVLDGEEHAEMQPGQPGSVLFDEAVAMRANDIGHLERWPCSFLVQPSRPLHLVRARQFRVVERRAGRFQMALGQMQVDGGGLEVGVPEQRLHGRQVGAAFHQMRGETVAQQMRAHGFGDARSLRRFPAGFPEHFGRDRLVGARAVDRAGKQVRLRLHPAPVLAQGLQQLRAQRHIAVLAAFALADVDEHAVAVDILDLQLAQLGSAHTGRVQRHQHGAMKQIAGRVDQPDRFFLRQNDRQAPRRLRIRHFFDRVGSLQRLAEEETQRRRV